MTFLSKSVRRNNRQMSLNLIGTTQEDQRAEIEALPESNRAAKRLKKAVKKQRTKRKKK